jgi:hypothetical protein
MFLFLLIIFPLLCVDFYICNRSAKYLVVFFIGFFLAVLVCTWNALFSYSTLPHSASFLRDFCYFLFTQTIYPVLLSGFLFLLFSKDSRDFKISCFLPLFSSFYSVFLPYRIISEMTTFPFFVLFFKPVLYAEMLLIIAPVLNRAVKAVTEKDRHSIFLYSGVLLWAAVWPAFVETAWYVGLPFYIWLPAWLFFTVAAVSCCLHIDAARYCAMYFRKFLHR